MITFTQTKRKAPLLYGGWIGIFIFPFKCSDTVIFVLGRPKFLAVRPFVVFRGSLFHVAIRPWLEVKGG